MIWGIIRGVMLVWSIASGLKLLGMYAPAHEQVVVQACGGGASFANILLWTGVASFLAYCGMNPNASADKPTIVGRVLGYLRKGIVLAIAGGYRLFKDGKSQAGV